MDFDSEEDQSIFALKKEYGIKQTTELMRFLIRQNFKEMTKSNPEFAKLYSESPT
jgi:hypothetical protein